MLDPEWSRPQAPQELKDQLYPLFKVAGVKGVYYEGQCSFRLPVWSVGLAGGGDYKGFSYRPIAHWKGEVINTPLDTRDRERKDIYFASRPLENELFLFFHHWP
ncbi:hypothetical protein [Methylobacillus sp.]|uniref:hypothetical protein n=1 Tax=Methylobacillus sp. TaxID=56818 RepID=UPI002FDFA24C